MPKIKVLLIEDNRLLREGVTSMLNEQPDMKVISSSGNGDAFVKARTLKPNVVLLDIGLRSQNSLRIAGLIKKEHPNTEVIIMDLIPTESEIAEYVSAGVAGFILKDATLKDFLNTIRTVAKGAKVLPPSLTNTVFSHIVEFGFKTGKADRMMKLVKLTKRETEVVNLISQGMSNKEISSELNIAVHTVKSHVHNTLEKLSLQTRLEIANFAHTEGVEEPSPTRDTKDSQ